MMRCVFTFSSVWCTWRVKNEPAAKRAGGRGSGVGGRGEGGGGYLMGAGGGLQHALREKAEDARWLEQYRRTLRELVLSV